MKGLLTILFFLFLISCAGKPDAPIHVADQVYDNMVEAAGTPMQDEKTSKGGSRVLYRYKLSFKDGVDKSRLIKNSIDKTLNALPSRDNPKDNIGGSQIILGDYGWETPHVKVDLNYFAKRGENDSSFVYVWLEKK